MRMKPTYLVIVNVLVCKYVAPIKIHKKNGKSHNKYDPNTKTHNINNYIIVCCGLK